MRAITEGGQWGEELPDHIHRFVDWLVMPRWERASDEQSQNQWAKKNGFTPGTVSNWKKHDRVKRLISQRADELNLSPDRVQEVMNALFEAATQGRDVKAMQLFLTHAEKLQPKKIVIEDNRIADMSEEELDAELRTLVAEGEL